MCSRYSSQTIQVQVHHIANTVSSVVVTTPLNFSHDCLHEGPRQKPFIFDSMEVIRNVAPFGVVYITGWEPIVSAHTCDSGESVQLIHHMNLLAGNTYRDEMRIMVSYDRGALGYRLPTGYGTLVGDTSLWLEHHILLPPCWGNRMVHDRSGFRLFVSKQQPRYPATMYGFSPQHMYIPKALGVVDHVTCLPSMMRLVEGLLVSDLHLLAVHLHTHDQFSRKWIEVVRKGRVVWETQVMFGGYGHGQSFFDVLPMFSLQSSDRICQHCIINTSLLTLPLIEGTSHGEEMCAPLILVGGPGLLPWSRTHPSIVSGKSFSAILSSP